MRLYFGLLLLFNVFVCTTKYIISIYNTVDIKDFLKCNLAWSILYTSVYVGAWCIAPYIK